MTKVMLMSGRVAGRTQEPEGQEKGKCSVWGITVPPSTVSSPTN